MAGTSLESDKLHLFLLSDGNQIDDNEYLESLETARELIASTEEEMQKLWIYFHIERHLHFKSILCNININYFI